ncbi:unnamed protein product [Chrysoparadoxa australica]
MRKSTKMRGADLAAPCPKQSAQILETMLGFLALLLWCTAARGFPSCFTPGSHALQRIWAKSRVGRGVLTMDDEVHREGIKEELTTRDEYLAERFTGLSPSGYDLTPMIPSEVEAAQRDFERLSAEGWFDVSSTSAFTSQTKGLYCCALSGLPVFTSGVTLPSLATEELLCFSEPCDPAHITISSSGEVRCVRSQQLLGRTQAELTSSSGASFLIAHDALVFHALGAALPVASQPENYWGSEGQYRAWKLDGS